MSSHAHKPSSVYSEVKMSDSTKVKFEVPIGTWGHTEVEIEYPWHRDLDSIILPLLESAHEAQAERQRRHHADSQPPRRSLSKSQKAVKHDSATEVVPARPNDGIKIYFKGFESAMDMESERGESFQTLLEAYAQRMERDVERLEVIYKGRNVGRGLTPDAGSRSVRSCKSTSSFNDGTRSRRKRRSRAHSTKSDTCTEADSIETESIVVVNGIDQVLSYSDEGVPSFSGDQRSLAYSERTPLYSDDGTISRTEQTLTQSERAPSPFTDRSPLHFDDRTISPFETQSFSQFDDRNILPSEDQSLSHSADRYILESQNQVVSPCDEDDDDDDDDDSSSLLEPPSARKSVRSSTSDKALRVLGMTWDSDGAQAAYDPDQAKRLSKLTKPLATSDKALAFLGLEDYPALESPASASTTRPRSSGWSAPTTPTDCCRIPSMSFSEGEFNMPYPFPSDHARPLSHCAEILEETPDPSNATISDATISTVSTIVPPQRKSTDKAHRLLGLDRPDRPQTTGGTSCAASEETDRQISEFHQFTEIHHRRHQSFPSPPNSSHHPKLTTTVSGPSHDAITELKVVNAWNALEIKSERRASWRPDPPVASVQYEVERKKAGLSRRCPRMSGFLADTVTGKRTWVN